MVSQHVDHQLEELTVRHQLSFWATGLATYTHVLLGCTGNIGSGCVSVATQLTTDGRGRTVDQPGDLSLTQFIILAQLDGDALFNTEFMI